MHEHTKQGPALITQTKGYTRAVETCECGAYRTFDHTWEASGQYAWNGARTQTDDKWSEWLRLQSTESDS